jgi:hypothetical protein
LPDALTAESGGSTDHGERYSLLVGFEDQGAETRSRGEASLIRRL